MNASRKYAIGLSFLMSIALLIPAAYGQTAPPVQTCTAHNIIGFPYAGLVCGGSVIDNCTPGALYQCQGGARDTLNNCTFSQSCAIGCLTGANSTGVTLNTSAPVASDACFVGPAPLTLSTNNTLGGNDVTLTATLTQGHSPYAIVNLGGTGSLVPPLCDVPLLLTADVNSLNFDRPTSVVTAQAAVPLHLLISYPDAATGRSRNLVSVPSVLTLNPGGTQLPSTIRSFTLTPSTIEPGQGSSLDLVLTRAPVTANAITVTSSHPAIVAVVGQPNVIAGCTGRAAGTLLAANFVAQTTAVTISVSAQGQLPVTNVLTVTASPLDLSTLALNPSSVSGGASSVATVTINRPAPSGGVQVFLAANPINGTLLSFPSSVTVPAGQTSVSFTVTVPATTVQDSITLVATIPGAKTSGGAVLTVNATPTTTIPSVISVSMNPASLTGGSSATGTVALNVAAPSGGVGVFLSSSSAAATVPSSVLVPAGQTNASFALTTSTVSATTLATISASSNGTVSTVLTVNPATATALTLSALSLNPPSVAGGSSSTGTVTLSRAAPSGGAVVSLSDNSSVSGVPASVTVPAGATSANFAVTTNTVTSSTAVSVSGSFGGTTRSATLTVNPAAPTAPALLSPANDTTPAQPVTLDWNDVATATSYEIQVDDSSTIAAPFIANQIVNVSQISIGNLPSQRLWWRVRAQNSAGVSGPFSATRRFTPQAATTAVAGLSAVSVSPTSMVGGNAATGTLTLKAAAPTGGAVVALSSDTAAATLATSVTIPAGATSTTFAVTTTAVAAATSATITATYGGTSRSAILTLNPPTTNVSLTVTASGRGGERLTSNPVGIDVTVGSTQSVGFAINSTITLSVSNGRDAVWSGACSSGGNKAKTCTFRIGGNASVTGNVQ